MFHRSTPFRRAASAALFTFAAIAAPFGHAQFVYITSNTTYSTPITTTDEINIDDNATLTIDGTTVELDYVTVGNVSNGSLVIQNQAALTTSGATLANDVNANGTALVTGGSTWNLMATLYVGNSPDAVATLTINGGSTVSTSSLSVGLTTGDTGNVTVSGSGSSLTTSGFNMASSGGSGTLRIESGATFANGSLSLSYIGRSSGVGQMIVTGNGSTASFAGALVLGNLSGNGTLTVAEGGSVSVGSGASNLSVGTRNGSGTLNIGAAANATAAAAGIINASRVVGETSNSTLQFNTTGTTYFTKDGTSTGTAVDTGFSLKIVVNGGTNVLSGDIAHNGATTINGGALYLNGSQIGASAITVHSGGTLGGDTAFGGAVTLNSGAALEIGAADNAVSTLTLNSGLTLASGSILNFDLGTTSDRLVLGGGSFAGADTAGGVTLNLAAATGFTAASYTLIDFSSAGSLSSVDLSDFALGNTVAGYNYALSTVGSTLQLNVTAIPEPSTYAALAGLAAIGAALLRRRRQS